MLRHRSSEATAVPDEFVATIQAALEELLLSDAFRNSRQSEKLFRYLVQHSLDGRDDLLREKQVGAAVFSREPDYDTAMDSIVRVRMNEIRKRLALYYGNNLPSTTIRFDVPRGSYRVEIIHSEAPADPKVPLSPPILEPRLLHGKWLWAGLARTFALACTAITILHFRASADALEDFWRPALDSRTPVLCAWETQCCSGCPPGSRIG